MGVERAQESTLFNASTAGLAGLYGIAPEFYGDIFAGAYYAAAYTPPPVFLDNTKRGEALPYFINEQHLRLLRNRSRRLAAENEIAVAALENRVSYIFGSGFTYRAIPAHDGVDESLTRECQKVVDVFVEANNLAEREADCGRRGDKDGEFFIRFFYRPNGLVLLRVIEPEHVRSPVGDGTPEKSFGIETAPHDIEDIRGYWVVQNPLENPVPQFVPAAQVLHCKFNTDCGAKRGVPLFYPVESNLRRAEELLAALGVTAKTRAKIALIRKIEGSTKAAAERLKSDTETGEITDPISGGVTNVDQLRLGTILTASKNIGYEYPDTGDSSGGIEVLKAELRSIAARLVMPESMLTADASGGTYSSQLVAEAPATRNFERLQRLYKSVFGESKAKGRESVVWRQIKYAVECRILRPETLTQVRIIAEAPAIIPRDPDKAAAANKTYFDMGVKSPQQICAELGGNWVQVERERKEAGLPPVSAQMAPGVPGMPGAPPPGEDDEAVDGEEQGQPGDDFEMDASMFEDL